MIQPLVKISSVLVALIVLLPALHTAQAQKMPDAVIEVKAALNAQIAAWNAGDLESAMAAYWNSPQMLWVSRAGVEKGYQPVLEGYRKDFADKSKMGVYSYEPLHIERLSNASVYYVFRWKIELNGKKTMGGISSQVWKKINKKWMIAVEHAS